MTRGGVRKGAGRPKLKVAKTANLCGVRVTPTQLQAYRYEALISNLTLSQWVTSTLDKDARSYDIAKALESYGYGEPTKRKGKKCPACGAAMPCPNEWRGSGLTPRGKHAPFDPSLERAKTKR